MLLLWLVTLDSQRWFLLHELHVHALHHALITGMKNSVVIETHCTENRVVFVGINDRPVETALRFRTRISRRTFERVSLCALHHPRMFVAFDVSQSPQGLLRELDSRVPGPTIVARSHGGFRRRCDRRRCRRRMER